MPVIPGHADRLSVHRELPATPALIRDSARFGLFLNNGSIITQACCRRNDSVPGREKSLPRLSAEAEFPQDCRRGSKHPLFLSISLPINPLYKKPVKKDHIFGRNQPCRVPRNASDYSRRGIELPRYPIKKILSQIQGEII